MLSPIAVQVSIATSGGSVNVPGKAKCSVEMPTGCSGRNVAGHVSGNTSRTLAR
jgi:hypothetical protein